MGVAVGIECSVTVRAAGLRCRLTDTEPGGLRLRPFVYVLILHSVLILFAILFVLPA